MSEKRNVTPDYEQEQKFPPGTFPNSGPGQRSTDMPPEWTGWSWAQSRERTFPWIGLLLVIVGGGLLIQYVVPGIGATTLVLAGISIAFFAGYLFGGSYVALIPGLLIGALVVARLIEELNIYTGSGTTALAVAAAFLIIWFIGATRGATTARGKQRTWSWALWAAGIFGLIGFVEVAGALGRIPEMGALWPILIIGIGLIVVVTGNRRSPRRRRRC